MKIIFHFGKLLVTAFSGPMYEEIWEKMHFFLMLWIFKNVRLRYYSSN